MAISVAATGEAIRVAINQLRNTGGRRAPQLVPFTPHWPRTQTIIGPVGIGFIIGVGIGFIIGVGIGYTIGAVIGRLQRWRAEERSDRE